MTTLTTNAAKKNLPQLIKDVAETGMVVQINERNNSAALISQDDWVAMNETLHLLSIPGMGESIRKGLKTPVAKCAKNLNW